MPSGAERGWLLPVRPLAYRHRPTPIPIRLFGPASCVAGTCRAGFGICALFRRGRDQSVSARLGALRYGLVVDVTAPGRALLAPLLWLSKVGVMKNKTRHRAATQTITGINAQISSSVPRGGIGLPFGR
jgi:hypothetical protein